MVFITVVASSADEAWSPSRKVLLYSTYAMSSVAVGLILGVVVNFDWWRSRGIAMIVDIQVGSASLVPHRSFQTSFAPCTGQTDAAASGWRGARGGQGPDSCELGF